MQAEQTVTVPDQIEALALYLRARYDEDEQIARRSVDPPDLGDRRGEWTFGEFGNQVRDSSGHLVVRHTWQEGEHIARHDRARVLARVKADRLLLDDLLAEKHLVLDEDCWYTCPAATGERDGGETCNDETRGGRCDCGRDERVARRLRLLALPYSGRDDFRAGWAADGHDRRRADGR